MVSFSSLPIGLSLNTHHASFSTHRSTVFKWGLSRDLDGRLFIRRTKGQAIRVLASPNVCITQGFQMYNANIFGLNIVKDVFRCLQGKEMQRKRCSWLIRWKQNG